MQKQWEHHLRGTEEEMNIRYNDLCSQVGDALNSNEEIMKDLQEKYRFLKENQQPKRTKPPSHPSPVNPVHVQPRSRSEPTKGRRIEAEHLHYTFAPLGTSQSLGGLQPLPSSKPVQPSEKSKVRSLPRKSDSRRETPSGKFDSERQAPVNPRKLAREIPNLPGNMVSKSDLHSGVSSLSGSSELTPDHGWSPLQSSFPQARVNWSIEE